MHNGLPPQRREHPFESRRPESFPGRVREIVQVHGEVVSAARDSLPCLDSGRLDNVQEKIFPPYCSANGTAKSSAWRDLPEKSSGTRIRRRASVRRLASPRPPFPRLAAVGGFSRVSVFIVNFLSSKQEPRRSFGQPNAKLCPCQNISALERGRKAEVPAQTARQMLQQFLNARGGVLAAINAINANDKCFLNREIRLSIAFHTTDTSIYLVEPLLIQLNRTLEEVNQNLSTIYSHPKAQGTPAFHPVNVLCLRPVC